MVAKRGSDKNRDSKTSGLQGDWKHVALVTTLAVAVFGTLIVGAVLQVDPDELPSRRLTTVMQEPATADAISDPHPEAPGAPPTGQTPAPALVQLLADRADRDSQRLAAAEDLWVLQIMYACDENTVRRLIDSIGPERRLHVLRDQDCFRLCWGPYRSRLAADSAIPQLPDPVAALGKPLAKPVAEVVR